MNPLDDLARTDIDPALLAQVRALVERQQAELAQRDATLARRDALLAEKDFKITALTQELAYYRRIRFGKASEALVGEQRQLFEETVDMDLAAIEEELEGQSPTKRQRTRAGRQVSISVENFPPGDADLFLDWFTSLTPSFHDTRSGSDSQESS